MSYFFRCIKKPGGGQGGQRCAEMSAESMFFTPSLREMSGGTSYWMGGYYLDGDQLIWSDTTTWDYEHWDWNKGIG